MEKKNLSMFEHSNRCQKMHVLFLAFTQTSCGRKETDFVF